MNNNLKSIFCAVALILVLSVGVRASEKQKSQTVTIQTSAICESCKARLEKKLKAVDGVEEAMLNLNNKKIKIKFDPTKTNVVALREIISGTGYDADALKKNAEAFDKLPQCCQKPME